MGRPRDPRMARRSVSTTWRLYRFLREISGKTGISVTRLVHEAVERQHGAVPEYTLDDGSDDRTDALARRVNGGMFL